MTNIEDLLGVLFTPSSPEAQLLKMGAALLTNETVQGEIAGIFDTLFSPPCHSAADVAQDALDAYDRGNLSAEAALKIAAIAIADEEKRRSTMKRA